MSNTEQVYVTYIKSTPEKVWQAITTPEFTRQYWANENISDWKKGSSWKHATTEGVTRISGEVLESDPPKRLSLSWSDPNEAALGTSRVSFEIATFGELVQLTVVHDQLKADGIMAGKVGGGWPRVLSGLKTFLETGEVLDIWAGKSSCSSAA